MPTITASERPKVVDSENFQQPRRTIRASTGMNMPKAAAIPQTPPSSPQTGQSTPVVDPTVPAVTLSPQLTALARQQQKLQREIQAQRDKEAAWEKEKSGYIPKESVRAKAQQNAVEALQEAMGMSYEELANLMITQQNSADPVQKLAAEVEQLKTNQVEQTNKQFDAIVKQYKAEATTMVKKDANKFAFLEANPEWIDGAVQHIVDEWEANPDNVVSIDDALALAEETLRDDAKKAAQTLAKLEGPKTPAPAPQTNVPTGRRQLPPPQNTAARTLTQSMESGAPTRPKNQFQHLSMKERLDAAIQRAQR